MKEKKSKSEGNGRVTYRPPVASFKYRPDPKVPVVKFKNKPNVPLVGCGRSHASLIIVDDLRLQEGKAGKTIRSMWIVYESRKGK